MNKTILIFIAFLSCSIFAFGDVNWTVGTDSSTYPNLINAFNAINSGSGLGNVTITIVASHNQPGLATLNAPGSHYSSVSIVPNGGPYTITYTGSQKGTMFKLNESHNVTFNGLYNNGQNLIFYNNKISGGNESPGIFLIYGSSISNTIENCRLRLDNPGTGDLDAAIVFDNSSSSVPSGNVIENCLIKTINYDGNKKLQQGIKFNDAYHAPTNPGTGSVISNCEFVDIEYKAISLMNNAGNGWQIFGNSFYQTVIGNSNYYAIEIKTLNSHGHAIYGNYIGGKAGHCGGNYFEINQSKYFKGIFLEYLGNATTTQVYDNIIQNFDHQGADFMGIHVVSASLGTSMEIDNNLIGNETDIESIKFDPNSNGLFYGIYLQRNAGQGSTSCNDYTVTANQVTGISGNSASQKTFYGIVGEDGFGLIERNKIYQFKNYTTQGSSVSTFYGIGIKGWKTCDWVMCGNMVSFINDDNYTVMYGLYEFPEDNSQAQHVYFNYNSVRLAGNTGIQHSMCFYKYNKTRPTDVKNNILVNYTSGSGRHSVYMYNEENSLFIDYNCCYTKNDADHFAYRNNSSASYTWTQWGAGSPNPPEYDTHGVNHLPVFVNNATDLSVNVDPLLSGMGIPPEQGCTEDINGNPRDNCAPSPGINEITGAIWTGSMSNDWSVSGNWNPASSVPSNTSVRIPYAGVTNMPLIKTDVTIKGLVILEGATLTVNPGKSLTTDGQVILNSANALVLKSGYIANPGPGQSNYGNSSFIDNCGITYNGGTIHTDLNLKSAAGCQGCWHYVSIPVQSAVAGTFVNKYLQFFNEGNGEWSGNISDLALNLNVLQGYAVNRPVADTALVHFTGKVNSGDISIDLNRTVNEGWGYNLVGNPYPSPLDLSEILGVTCTNIDPTVWYYSQMSGSYKTYSKTGGSTGGTQYCPSMQGFFVHVNSSYTSGTFKVINSARTIAQDTGYFKSITTESDLLYITATCQSNEFDDMLSVMFTGEATSNYEPEFDASKMYGHVDAPQIYTVTIDDAMVAINKLPYAGVNTVVPMSFRVFNGLNETYILTATNLESFRSGTSITLEDLKENKTQDLMANPVYTFNYGMTDDPARFLLHFNNPYFGVGEKPKEKEVSIYSSGNTIYISNKLGSNLKGEVMVYNILGENITHIPYEGAPMTKLNLNVTDGYYVVRVVTQDQSYNGKVYLD